MRIIVDIPRAIFDRAYTLIEAGRYRSLNEAIGVALESQLTLDETKDQAIVVAADVVAAHTGKRRPRPLAETASQRVGRERQADRPPTAPKAEVLAIPDAIRGILSLTAVAAPMPDGTVIGDRKYWLWGINRVAPIKTACRILAVLAANGSGTIGLDKLHELGGAMARQVGDYLAAQDGAARRKHGARLSSGFPRSSEDDVASQKSSDRFCDFFFGSVRKRTGRVDGALYELRLAMIEPRDGDSATIGPTAAGLEFARLRSPVLDGSPGSLDRALSEEEGAWYLRHMRSHVPQEYEILARSMRYIQNGRGGTHQFLQAMSSDYPTLSEKARSSLRVCVIGRLLDLGWVTRHEDGNYGLTHAGSDALR